MARNTRTHFSPKQEGSSDCDDMLDKETKSEPSTGIIGETAADWAMPSVGGEGSVITELRV